MEKLINYLRSHGWARRGLSVVSVSLVLLAVGLLGYPVYTNVVQNRIQDDLGRQYASPELLKKYKARTIKEGDALTRIKIPKLDVDTIVVEGISASALKAGAGHYPQTPLPCEAGNVSIAGHRTTYGKPFANVDRLVAGDIILLETPIGTCTYEVAKESFVVSPDDFSVIANDPAKRTLTLTTCHPKGSAGQAPHREGHADEGWASQHVMRRSSLAALAGFILAASVAVFGGAGAARAADEPIVVPTSPAGDATWNGANETDYKLIGHADMSEGGGQNVTKVDVGLHPADNGSHSYSNSQQFPADPPTSHRPFDLPWTARLQRQVHGHARRLRNAVVLLLLPGARAVRAAGNPHDHRRGAAHPSRSREGRAERVKGDDQLGRQQHRSGPARLHRRSS